MRKIKAKNCSIITAQDVVDCNDGRLAILEHGKNVPFDIRRVYYIYDLFHHSATRGRHAHKTLWQVIFCVRGNFVLELDDGCVQEKICVNTFQEGILVGPWVWHEMKQFSNDCVLLVIASDLYDESDYIRDYAKFKCHIQSNGERLTNQ